MSVESMYPDGIGSVIAAAAATPSPVGKGLAAPAEELPPESSGQNSTPARGRGRGKGGGRGKTKAKAKAKPKAALKKPAAATNTGEDRSDEDLDADLEFDADLEALVPLKRPAAAKPPGGPPSKKPNAPAAERSPAHAAGPGSAIASAAKSPPPIPPAKIAQPEEAPEQKLVPVKQESKIEITKDEEAEIAKLGHRKVPSAVLEARGQLEKAGVDLNAISASDLKEKLPDETLKRLFSAYGSALQVCPQPQSKCKAAAKSQDEKREWLARFVVDPKTAGADLSAKSDASVGRVTDKVREYIWITENQMAGPLCCNSKEDAAIQKDGLESRPHESAKMREHNIKQYKWIFKKETETDRKEEKTTVRADASMNEADYQAVRDRMLGLQVGSNEVLDADPSPDGKLPRKGKTPQQKEAEKQEREKKERELQATDPQKAALLKAKQGLTAEIAKTKTWCRMATGELGDAPALAARLDVKGFPAAMGQFLVAKGAEHGNAVSALNDAEYTQAKVVLDKANVTLDELMAARETLENKRKETEAKFNQFKKDNLEAIKKMS